MTENNSPKSRQEVEAQIIAKAWSDERFAQLLRTDPVAAIEQELGTKVADGLKIEVHEENVEDGVWHLVIPPAPIGEVLSDQELEAVAGGVRLATSYAAYDVRAVPFRYFGFISLDPERGG